MIPINTDENLEIRCVRFYPDMWKVVEGFTRKNAERWENESHFVRAAVLNFADKLDREGVSSGRRLRGRSR